MTYTQPRAQLHRSFLYLDHDAVSNALAMLKPDWADPRSAARRPAWPERAITRAGGARPGTSPERSDPLRFAAFDAWLRHLEDRHAFGSFDTWDESARDSLEVGHTLRFQAQTVLTPLVKVIGAMVSFAANAEDPDSLLSQGTASTARLGTQARKMESLLREADGTRRLSMYLEPLSGSSPKIVTRIHERYLVPGLNRLEGGYHVIVQVESLLRHGESENIVRLMGSEAATPIEIDAIAQLASKLAGSTRKLGVELTEGDITFTYPTVFVQPIAIYR